jgi:hypothetical protein
MAAVLRGRFGYAPDHLIELAGEPREGARQATRENVRAALADLRQRASKDDVVLIVLIGHGTATDADDAKFNLVGPDLTAGDWADLIKPIAGRIVFVNGASGSYPFLQKLAARGRVVITATDAIAQQYETTFPEFFLAALIAAESDADKNGKTSVWEAFSYASRQVRDWYEQAGRLSTERPLLDDTGGGIGREAQSPGPDGALAQATYFDAERPIPETGDSELTALLRRKAALQNDIDLLRARKNELPSEQYDAQMEQFLLQFAQVDGQIRAKSPGRSGP